MCGKFSVKYKQDDGRYSLTHLLKCSSTPAVSVYIYIELIGNMSDSCVFTYPVIWLLIGSHAQISSRFQTLLNQLLFTLESNKQSIRQLGFMEK